MKNIKRIITVMAVVFALFNFLVVQSKAAEWKEEEVVELIKTRISKERFEDSEKNNKVEATVEKSLVEDRVKLLYVYMGILLIISIITVVVAIKTETPQLHSECSIPLAISIPSLHVAF